MEVSAYAMGLIYFGKQGACLPCSFGLSLDAILTDWSEAGYQFGDWRSLEGIVTVSKWIYQEIDLLLRYILFWVVKYQNQQKSLL